MFRPPASDYLTSAEKISQFVPSTGTNLAWDGGQVKFVNILSIRANRNRTEGYLGRCREKYPYISVCFARLDKLIKGSFTYRRSAYAVFDEVFLVARTDNHSKRKRKRILNNVDNKLISD